MGGSKTAKFVNVFSLESFLLHSIIIVQPKIIALRKHLPSVPPVLLGEIFIL